MHTVCSQNETFKKINNEEQETNLIHFIRDPEKKQKIISQIKKGLQLEISITEIFTDSYLHEFNYNGVQSKKPLKDNVIFKEIFLHVNEHIDKDILIRHVLADLNAVKSKIRTRETRKRKHE